MKYSTLNVRARLVLMTVVIMILAMGISTFISSRIFIRAYSRALQSETLSIGQSVKLQLDRIMKLGLNLEDIVGFEKQCQEIVESYEIISYAMVMDLEGKILFHNDPSMHDSLVTDRALLDAVKRGQKVIQSSLEQGLTYYNGLLPVFDSYGEHIAAVRVGFSQKLITGKIGKIAVSSLVVGLVALSLAIGLLFFAFSIWVTKPLLHLLHTIQAIRTRGAISSSKRVDVQSDDEIGELSAAFNQMASELEASHEKVKRYADDLELRVQERTEELEKSKNAAEAANRSKSEFLANMSHELRTPLNHIIGFTELVVDKNVGDLNEIQEEYLHDVLHSSKHLLSLINDILDLSKVEVGKLELEATEVNLRRLLADSVIIVQERAMKQGIILSTDLDNIPEILEADERKLKQILYNLLSNAVKFTPKGGAIRLSAENVAEDEVAIREFVHTAICNSRPASGDYIEISVKDTGIGIRQEDLARIFDPFEQVESSTNRRYQGTGLGLALTKRFVEMHGGRIWVESEGAGKGSTFRLIIPNGNYVR